MLQVLFTSTLSHSKTSKPTNQRAGYEDLILLNREPFPRSTQQLWTPLLRTHKALHELRLLQQEGTSDRPSPISSFSVYDTSAAILRAFSPCSSRTTWAARSSTFPATSRKTVFASIMSTGFIPMDGRYTTEIRVIS